MVGPLIIIGSNGSIWSHTRVLERIGQAMRLCGSRCASGVAPSMGRNFPRRCLEKVCRSGPEPPRVRRRPKLEDGRALEAVCVWPRAPSTVARNASSAEIRSHSGHDLGRMDEVAGDLLIPTTRARYCLPFRLDLAR
jgi:hypothetical protein